jgi:DNA repair protein RecN (Recombination protein N)
MIKNLKVKNIALIDDLNVNFENGLTALTGETGAGKSILMESLQLLFGKRTDQDLIRHGTNEAYVSGTFFINKELAKKFDLNQEIEIKRLIQKKGRHEIRLNGRVTTIQKIRSITRNFGDIHDQDDMFQLLDPKFYTTILDDRDKEVTENLKIKYLLNKEKYEEAKKRLKKLIEEKEMYEKEKDIISHQHNEIEKMKLVSHELENLTDEINTLKHYDIISHNLKESVNTLKSNNLLESLNQIKTNIFNVSSKIDSKKDLLKRFEDSYYEIEDIFEDLRNMLNDLYFDEEHYESLNQREYELKNLEKKYNKSVEELILYKEELKSKLDLVSDFDSYIKKENEMIKVLKDNTINSALKITNQRKLIARDMELELIGILKKLDLEQTQFKVEVKNTNNFFEDGMDEIYFKISLNNGEPMKELNKVASGGERSRFMFALKTTAATRKGISMLILDEIDSGVSGKTASKLANHMSLISKKLQLLVITHLPQVAAKADIQMEVLKKQKNDRVITYINKLNYEERVKSIATMLSDETMSEFAIKQAKTLLEKKDKLFKPVHLEVQL